jgi:hypothetical protein
MFFSSYWTGYQQSAKDTERGKQRQLRRPDRRRIRTGLRNRRSRLRHDRRPHSACLNLPGTRCRQVDMEVVFSAVVYDVDDDDDEG